MDYLIYSAERAGKFGIITEGMRSWAKGSNGFAVCARDSTVFSGVSLFTFDDDDDTASLDYIFVQDEYRERGISSEMLHAAETFMKNEGIRKLSCTVAGQDEEVIRWYSYLTLQGFENVISFDHILEYPVMSLSANKGFAALMQKLPVSIMEGSRVSEQALRAYENRLIMADNVRLKNIGYDPELSAFYTENGRICGCMTVMPDPDTGQAVICSYIDSDAGDTVIFPKLLAFAVSRVIKRNDRLTRIRLYTHGAEIYNAVRAAFGEAEQELLLQKFYRKL